MQTILFFFSRFFVSLCGTQGPKFNIEILKRDFEKTLKQFFQKSFKNIYRDISKSKIIVWVTSHVKINQLSQNLDVIFAVNKFNL